MEHDAWFFIGVFVFIFLIWIATGGPLHPLAFAGPSLSLPGVLGGGTYLSLPRAPLSIGDSNTALPGSSSGSDYSGNTGTAQFLPGNTAFGAPSPYRGKVVMNHYVSGAGSSDPNSEYIQLRVSQDAGVPVDLTGWVLMSEATGASMAIPKGTEVPSSGVVNQVQDLILDPGEQALLISGRSPIGASFRENRCIGYYATFQKFSPSLPMNCPAASDELSRFYGPDYIRDASCIEYVNTVGRCQAVLTPPTTVSPSCQSFFISHLNYNGCVDAHKSDRDFLGDTWRIYLGRTNAMWRSQHEIVKLLDIKGNTVDAFSY